MSEEKQSDMIIKSFSAQEQIVAAVPKEAFKAMFYMFAGKPDSKVKLFKRPVVVKPDDVYDLNTKVVTKLRLHHIDLVVASATIKFDKEESRELGTWAELETFDWKVPFVTQEVALRWDFLIKLQAYHTPQRHTLTVRISSSPRPRDIFQIMISQDPDDDTDISDRFALCVARVDFISHRLADELIDVVEEWNGSLKQPSFAHSWFAKISSWDNAIARSVHMSVPVFFTGFALALLRTHAPTISNEPATTSSMFLVAEWMLISILGLFVITRFSSFLGGRCFKAINQFGKFSPFYLTRGDENQADDNDRTNQKRITSFFLHAGFAIIINLLAVAIAWYILPK